jgi:glycine cleavage system regulatory protein
VEANGGNWHESGLSQLQGQFAGMVLVSLPEDSAGTLEAQLRDLAASGLSVRVTPTSEVATPAGGKRITLTVLGPDRPGIVREISSALARRQINVLEMESEVQSAPMSGEMLFNASIESQVPADTDIDDLRDALDDIANQMTLDIDIA